MKISKYLLIGAASLLSLSTLAPTASAAEAISDVTISFTATTDGGGSTGALTLDTVPQINFGSAPLSLNAETYNASTSPTSYLQVTDQRGGGGIGWNVTAKATPFSLGSTGSTTIQGAKIIFKQGSVFANGNHTFDSPTTSSFSLDTDGTAASASVVKAEAGTGLDSWQIDWTPADSTAATNSNITLFVPAGAASEGNFTSTITWTLSDAPA